MQNVVRKWRALWNPDMYHGWGKSKNYFEGWYIKVVDPTEQYALAFIPGISMESDGAGHSFIQVLNGKKCTAEYYKFNQQDFSPANDQFAVNVVDNYFSQRRINLNLPDIQGELHFSNHFAWPKMLGAPGIMGWYSFVPFMQCYHGIVSMNHQIKGSLNIDGKTIDFDAGKGYIEKDWGSSFPSSWIWMQSNHFETDRQISLMFSLANIPWLGSYFNGFIAGFLLDDKLYKFATYSGAKVKGQLDNDKISLSLSDKKHHLEIIAHQGPGGELVSPVPGKMAGKVNESLQATIAVSFYENDKLLYQGTGRNAGLEIAGKAEQLIS